MCSCKPINRKSKLECVAYRGRWRRKFCNRCPPILPATIPDTFQLELYDNQSAKGLPK